MKLFVLISGIAVVLSSRCFAKDCESCSFQTGCLWQSVSMNCVEIAACTPVGACVDRPSFCYPRALLAKALQEGRVETQIFNALTPSQDKTSYTCQLDECSTSQDPKNICKVMGGVNYEVRKTTDPTSETAMITKYMYVCICGPEWEAGPNHRNCRKREPPGFGSDSAGDGSGSFFSRPPDGMYGGYNFAYGPTYGMPYGGFPAPDPYKEITSPYKDPTSFKDPNSYKDILGSYKDPYKDVPNPYQNPGPPQSFSPPFARLVPSSSSKVPRLIQFEYGNKPSHISDANISNANSSKPSNSTNPKSTNSTISNSTISNSTISNPNSSNPNPSNPNPNPTESSNPANSSNSSNSTVDPNMTAIQFVPPGLVISEPIIITSVPVNGILISGGMADAEPADYSNNDDEYGPYNRGEIIVPSEQYPRNRTTLASLIPTVEEGPDDDDDDDGKGHRDRKPEKPKKKMPPPERWWRRNETRVEPDEVPLAPTTRPPTTVDMVPQVVANIIPRASLQPSDQERLAFLEYLVYSAIGVFGLAMVGLLVYYLYQRKSAKKARKMNPIPFVMNELDPEYSKNSDGGAFPLEVSCDDWDAVSKRACEDAWAKLGGLPGKGMSQVVIYYGTPYASVVRSQDNAPSITEDCRDNVIVDVTLTPEEQSVSSSVQSSCQTRAKFRYVLRRDNSQSSRSGSMSTHMSLVSNNSCSTSDSGAEY